ncbi:aminoglycoside 6-adenylyltransferase [Desmospora activa]|uniref:Aminoglycoside 6-adenylyltransferase n=1 Tax=Desmospora activa DSM 45169 TaxID=1121389 RepID=A0A2T4ZDC6_9BACL|nr:aminoglycoside 6-adenylyltransferase [Desmospora activa]PTM59901.1 aminoglycoside 6-adenylyltransferase [Desmospora activa DSM 45169]
MRNEREMLDLILGFAKRDERIRAVMMNGSRLNAEAPRDIFQDYDIVYFVTAVDDFVADRSWIRSFGDILMMQTPDEMEIPPADGNDSFAYLMLFTDGNRIDLTFYPINQITRFKAESLSMVLLDKDNKMETLPPPSNRDFLPMPPTEKQFLDCCNEFWWVSTYVAKGLWRGELGYAKVMFERPVRDMLMVMLNWYIGIHTNFSADPGKCGKYYKKYLDPEKWNAFVKTFSDAEVENMWQALFVMCALFRETAQAVANQFGYRYPLEDDKRVTAYLKRVKDLPRDASRF